MADTLPKGYGKSKKHGADKIGIGVAIGITAVALIIGIGFTGILPMGEESNTVMQPTPDTPIVQEKPSTTVTQQAPSGSYVPMKSSTSYFPSDKDVLDQLDWSISTGDVTGMYIDKSSSGLIIYTDTTDDAELFIGLNEDYIGSDDGTFFIIVDNQEHENYEQAGMDLYIDLPAGAETVEIIGSYIIS